MTTGAWTFFSRGEMTENRELVEAEGDEHGPAYRVGKISAGAIRDVRLGEHLTLGVGALAAVNFVGEPLEPLYGSRTPLGGMGFVRLKLE